MLIEIIHAVEVTNYWLARHRYRFTHRLFLGATAHYNAAKAALVRRYKRDAHAVRLATPVISTTANAPRGGPAIDQAEHYVWRPSTTAKVNSTKGGHRRN
jgi:hypothetical protein